MPLSYARQLCDRTVARDDDTKGQRPQMSLSFRSLTSVSHFLILPYFHFVLMNCLADQTEHENMRRTNILLKCLRDQTERENIKRTNILVDPTAEM
jgi:hypothetical protein